MLFCLVEGSVFGSASATLAVECRDSSQLHHAFSCTRPRHARFRIARQAGWAWAWVGVCQRLALRLFFGDFLGASCRAFLSLPPSSVNEEDRQACSRPCPCSVLLLRWHALPFPAPRRACHCVGVPPTNTHTNTLSHFKPWAACRGVDRPSCRTPASKHKALHSLSLARSKAPVPVRVPPSQLS